MKVLLVTLSDNADHQDTTFGLYEQLCSIYDTYLLAIKSPKVPIEVTDHTWFIRCPKRPGIEAKTFDIFTLGSIIRKIRKEKFDVVYFESLHVWNVAIMVTLNKSTKIYQVIHEVIPHEGDSQENAVDFMNKIICKTSNYIVLRNRKYVNDMVEKYNIDSKRVKYLELWRRYPDYIEPVYSKKVLFFGRINPYKGANNLLEIVRKCPTVTFKVVGRVDPQMNDIVEKLKKEKNVILKTGYVSDEEMRKEFVNADWIIVPYNSASQSGIIIDAYKYSRPVIAYNVGAISEQIDDGKSGYLIVAGDNQAFADKITNALSMPKDSYRSMCCYAYQYGCQKYAANGAVERFCKLIEEKEK